jgi:hypothetical protein
MTRAEDWGGIADDAISAFELADTGGEVPFAYAYLIRGIARRFGWDDPRVDAYLAKLYSLRNPDGGWGLGYVFTGPGGVANPANTTYTITLSDHVGPTLIEAYLARPDLVPLADIQTLASLVMTTQTWSFPTGKAVSYSRNTHDDINATNGRNVHNVNASAGLFLCQAQAVGAVYGGLNKRVVDIGRFESSVYNPTTAWWPYKGQGSTSGDTDHTALQAEAMYLALAEQMGRETAYRILSDGVGGIHDDEPAARIAWARLAGLPPIDNALSGTTTLWLVLADAYLTEVADFVTTCNTAQKAQIACWAARAADQAAEVL